MNCQVDVVELLSNLAFQVTPTGNLIFSFHLQIIKKKRRPPPPPSHSYPHLRKAQKLPALGESQDSAHATWGHTLPWDGVGRPHHSNMCWSTEGSTSTAWRPLCRLRKVACFPLRWRQRMKASTICDCTLWGWLALQR